MSEPVPVTVIRGYHCARMRPHPAYARIDCQAVLQTIEAFSTETTT